MKRNILIAIFSILSQAAVFAAVMAAYVVFTTGDYLIGVTLAGLLSAVAGPLAWEVLDQNMKRAPRVGAR